MADEISDNEDLEKIMLQICDKDLLQAGAIGSDDDFAVEQLLRVPDNHAKHDHGKQWPVRAETTTKLDEEVNFILLLDDM